MNQSNKLINLFQYKMYKAKVTALVIFILVSGVMAQELILTSNQFVEIEIDQINDS